MKIHFPESGYQCMNRGENISRMCTFGNGVHVTDGESNTCRRCVNRCENSCHGVGSGVATTDIDLERDPLILACFLNQGIQASGGDGANTMSKNTSQHDTSTIMHVTASPMTSPKRRAASV